MSHGQAVLTSSRRTLRLFIAIMAVVVVTAAMLLAFQPPQKAQALSGSAFNPGNIISDAVFYDSGTMSESDIQAFLNSQVPTCAAGYTCLKNYTENTNSRGADSLCGAYSGGSGRSAASILYSVARSCGINPQVLLVMLQKEQGLVTATSPTSTRFTIAMGYACPDTAPCDTTFYGFFNQMYSAAHQLKNYQANPNYWSYRAGRVNTIYWHPNASCGTSQVYIENQATAALYIYTPYRPNQAALDNLYGSGDSCSSYGNRNFWRYFSDWFGNSLAGGSLIRTADNPKVYVTNSVSKYYVPDVETLGALAPLGPVRIVSQSDIDRLNNGPNAGRALYDQATGDVFYAEAGLKHHAPTCELLLEYGASCGQMLYLTTGQLALFGTGPELTGLVKAPGVATVYYLSGGKKLPVVSWDDAVALAGRNNTDVLQLPSPWIAAKATGKSVLGPSRLVKTSASPMVYMIDGLANKIPVPSFDLPAEMGITTYATVASSVLDGYSTTSALAPNLTCGNTTYLAGAGKLWMVSSLNGLPSSAVDQRTCDALPRANSTPIGSYFLKQSGAAPIYLPASNTKRPISSMEAVFALAGTSQPFYVPMSATALNRITTGKEALGPTLLVKSPSSPAVFFVDGLAAKIPVDSFAVPAEFGRTGYVTVSQGALDGYPTAPGPLRSNLTCAGATYLGGGGALWNVKSTNGLPTTPVDSLSCATLPRTGPAAQDEFFVKTAADSASYFVSNGTKRYVTSAGTIGALAPTGSFMFVTMSSAAIAAMPTGPDILPPGGRVKSSNSSDIYFITGLDQKSRVTSFDILADLGQTSFVTLGASSLSAYPTTAEPLKAVLKSGSTYYLAQGGRLNPLAAADGYGVSATEIDAKALATLGTPGPTIGGRLFIKSTTADTVYVVESGGKRSFSSMAELIAYNGGSNPTIYTLRPASMDSFPTR
jgi:hypothetical protein